MKDSLVRAYHRLPAGPRSVAASLWGFYLRSWRYGPETERLVNEAIERESWPQDRWRAWRDERLAEMLHRAATTVPYYRDQWSARRQRGDRASWEQLENWPILEKDVLRDNPQAFLADSCRPGRMFHDQTSGTSGTPLTLYWSRRTLFQWYALAEARWRLWYGVSRRDRWAILGGQVVAPAEQQRPPFWVWNAGLNQLYLSSYHLAPDLIAFYLDAIAEFGITYALGYSSSLHAVARGALRLGRTVPLRVAITNAEPVFPEQRDAVSRAFACPVRETYGMAEAVAAASECDRGTLHLWPEAGVVEVVDRDQRVPAGTTGDLVCTGLLNADMPLVRYRIGDRGSLGSQESCACGRTLPRLGAIEGRIDDVLFTRDGRRIGRLDPIFKASLPMVEAQIVQERLDRVRVRYVPAPGYSPSAGSSLAERLRDRMGDVEVVLEEVDRIPRTSRGKFRAVVCELPAAERQALEVR